MSDTKLSIACSLFRESLLNTPISPGGSGWSGRCSLGDVYWNGNIFPTAALGGSTFDSYGKLLPAGTPNLIGTSVESQSVTGYFGFSKQDLTPLYAEQISGRDVVGNTSKESGMYVGIGHFSTADNSSWETFSIRREIDFGITYYLWGPKFVLRPTIGFGIESIIDINKPDGETTLRDNARMLSLRTGISFEWRQLKNIVSNREEYEGYSKLSLFHYLYSDIISGIISFIDYKAVDRDAAVAQSYTEEAIGAQESTGELTATSDVPTLLIASHMATASTGGDMRRQFHHLKNAGVDWLLEYHIGRTLLISALTAAADRSDVLASAALSSARNLMDLWALRSSASPKTAMAAHLAIGSGMMLLGSLANDSKYGKGLLQAGMEGVTATTLSPNAMDDETWAFSTEFSYLLFSSYSRSNIHGDNLSQPSLRIQKNSDDSPLYTAATVASPALDIRSAGGRAKAVATDSEGDINYANTDQFTPSSVASTIGLEGSTGDEGSLLSLHGHIGAGPQLEWNNTGTEPGISAEIGAGLSLRILENWRVGLASQCSATKLLHGDSTNCSAGFSLTRKSR